MLSLLELLLLELVIFLLYLLCLEYEVILQNFIAAIVLLKESLNLEILDLPNTILFTFLLDDSLHFLIRMEFMLELLDL